jgi:hypothetical protein
MGENTKALAGIVLRLIRLVGGAGGGLGLGDLLITPLNKQAGGIAFFVVWIAGSVLIWAHRGRP